MLKSTLPKRISCQQRACNRKAGCTMLTVTAGLWDRRVSGWVRELISDPTRRQVSCQEMFLREFSRERGSPKTYKSHRRARLQFY
jgi:hypothetical protein